MRFTETKIKRLKTVKGTAVGFRIDQIKMGNGKRAVREYLDHPGAVAILPFVTKNRVLLVKQFRYPVGKTTYEIPAGKLDAGETILKCLRRELAEETGYTAKKIKKLVSFWPTPAFANEIIHIYTAENLTKGAPHPDQDEMIRCEVWPFKKVLRAIRKGKILDSKTIVAVLAYAQSFKT